MNPWDIYKKAFNAWENATATYMEQVLKSPLLLEPAGAWLSTMMKAKAKGDELAAGWWGGLGLPTKRDQERTLHKLNQLESKPLDLEERLAEGR
jgi:hypothetical protein